jgi:metal-sulfur cluster biosynthetic enzyme
MIDPLVTSAAYAALAEVVDPELGLDIVELGLVYDVHVAGRRVTVDMTLTTPGCPVSELLPAEASDALARALPDHEIDVRVVWDPPWTPDHISDAGRAALGFAAR